MNDDWILSVLSDLQTFAKANKLEALAEQLQTTKCLAAIELSQRGFDDAATGKGGPSSSRDIN
jgi:hypothetical protein